MRSKDRPAPAAEPVRYLDSMELLQRLRDRGIKLSLVRLRDWLAEGRVPGARRIGRGWYAPESCIDALLDGEDASHAS